jgi:S-adenosylmethionine-dependent methyltransferase
MSQLELYSTHRIRSKPEILEPVRRAVIEHRFKRLTGWDENGETRYARDIDRHAYARHDTTIEYLVPWVNQAAPLKGKSIVEIGCGTGSSTAAFAKFCDHIDGYDISESSIEGARARLVAHGLSDKASLHAAEPMRLLQTIEDRHSGEKADIVLMFALLEHQTLTERLETLRIAQRIVKPGGHLVVCETPNRLTYFDRHTSQLPFFHMLPLDLQALVAAQSPRADFRDNIAVKRAAGVEGAALDEHLIRWGQSVSYHDFDLAMESVDERIRACGNHPNLMRLRPPKPEEAALRQYMESAGIARHPGFTRYFLDLVIQAGE